MSNFRGESLVGALLRTAVLLLLAACANQAPAPVTPTVPVRVTMFGVYATTQGQDLYTYRGSNNEIPESKAWTPLMAHLDDEGDKDFQIVTRSDGNLQWSFRGQPVYYYKGNDAGLRSDPDYRAGNWQVLKYPYGYFSNGTSGGH